MRVHLIGAVVAAIGSAAMGVPTFVPDGEHQAPIVDLGYAVHSAHHNVSNDLFLPFRFCLILFILPVFWKPSSLIFSDNELAHRVFLSRGRGGQA
jgi:hypothetical protein